MCLLIHINKICTLYMITHFYRLCMQLFRAIALHPSFLEIMCSKKVICFLKTRHFKKHHLFNNFNQQSMHILHNRIILYISYTICIRKSLLPHVSKNIDLRFFPFFLTKLDLKKCICLINQIEKVCTFYIIPHFMHCV